MINIFIHYDPSLGLTWFILSITLLVVIWKLLGHGSSFIAFMYKELRRKDSTEVSRIAVSNSLANSDNSALIRWLRKRASLVCNGLLITYLITILCIVYPDYPVFNKKAVSFDAYLIIILDTLMIQLLAVCTACLLWCYANNTLRRVLMPSLWILLLDIFIELGLQLYQHPTFHWVQRIEILASGIVLLIVPVIGLVLIKNMHKLTAIRK